MAIDSSAQIVQSDDRANAVEQLDSDARESMSINSTSSGTNTLSIDEPDNQNTITPLLPSGLASQLILQHEQILDKDLKDGSQHLLPASAESGVIGNQIKEEEDMVFTKPTSVWPQVSLLP